MTGAWTPEYPGQTEPVWVWWDRDEPEDGLVGFHTRDDVERFRRGEAGPFRRRVSPTGKTIPQTEDWHAWVKRMIEEGQP